MQRAKPEARVLSVLLCAQPAVFFAALQVFAPNGSHVLPAVVLGLLLGAGLYALFAQSIAGLLGAPTFFKIATLLLPCGLLPGVFIERFKSSAVYFVLLLVYFVALWVFYVRPAATGQRLAALTMGLLAVLVALEYCVITSPWYNPDSFSFLEMADTLTKGPFQTPTARQYLVFTDQALSFPYFYPLAIAVVKWFTGLGIYSGVLVNLLAMGLSVVFLYKASARLCKSPVPGGLAAVFMCCNADYLDELAAARSMPLAILCGILVLYFLCRLPLARGREIFLGGLFAGMAMATRFDAFVLAACAGVAVLVLSGKVRWKNLLLFAGGALVFTLPWILYSLVFFGTPWATDNGGTFWLLSPEVPQRYYSSTFDMPDFFSHPGVWFSQLFTLKLPAILKGLLYNLGVGGGALFGIWFVYMLALQKAQKWKDWFAGHRHLAAVVLTLAVTFALKTAMLTLVGYEFSRYHVETSIYLLLCAGMLLCTVTEGAKAPQDGLFRHTATLLALFMVATAFVAPNKDRLPLIGQNRKSYVLNAEDVAQTLSGAQEEMRLYIEAENPDARVLFLDDYSGFRFGAYSGIKTFAKPFIQPADADGMPELLDSYIRPDYIVHEGEPQGDWAQRYDLVAVNQYDGLTLFRVDEKPWLA